MTHPFRFMISMPPLGTDLGVWRDRLRAIEDAGFDTVAISDHIGGGWAMDPFIALAAAADVTSRLRLATLVLANDFRHPVLVHRAAAMLDVVSGGRLELGLGAGWRATDYQLSGVELDPPARRISRLGEAVDIIASLFGPEPVTYEGRYYRVGTLLGLPRPVQDPRPPIIVGGGGRRILELAAAKADIVAVNVPLGGETMPGPVADAATPEHLARQVGWVRDAARRGGRDPDAPVLQLRFYRVAVDRRIPTPTSSVGAAVEGQPGPGVDSPFALVGDVARCVDHIEGLRERHGFSYFHLGNDADAVAPIVHLLAGH